MTARSVFSCPLLPLSFPLSPFTSFFLFTRQGRTLNINSALFTLKIMLYTYTHNFVAYFRALTKIKIQIFLLVVAVVVSVAGFCFLPIFTKSILFLALYLFANTSVPPSTKHTHSHTHNTEAAAKRNSRGKTGRGCSL